MTREREEAAVLKELRDNGGYFTIFWACEHPRRAHALQRLEDSGRIINDTHELKLGFPRCHATIVET